MEDPAEALKKAEYGKQFTEWIFNDIKLKTDSWINCEYSLQYLIQTPNWNKWRIIPLWTMRMTYSHPTQRTSPTELPTHWHLPLD